MISIHAPRAGGDAKQNLPRYAEGISIHAPRAGGDWFRSVADYYKIQISIHAPRAGGDSTIWAGVR